VDPYVRAPARSVNVEAPCSRSSRRPCFVVVSNLFPDRPYLATWAQNGSPQASDERVFTEQKNGNRITVYGFTSVIPSLSRDSHNRRASSIRYVVPALEIFPQATYVPMSAVDL
jgi:hypothetical protein